MAFSRRSGRSRFTLIILVLASITVLTLDFRGSGLPGLRGVASTVFAPFRAVGDAVSEPFSNGWNGITGYDDLEEENERLRRRIDELEGQQITDAADRREIEALREMLRIQQLSDIPTVAARVVSGPLTSFDETIEIDRGSGDGVRKGMAVVTEAGLVGRVVRATGSRSSVQLITDPSFRFGVQLAEQGERGIAQGSGRREGTVEVNEGITLRTQVERGDPVVTAGYEDNAFPPGVPVGRVASVGLTDDRTERTLVITPSADLGSLTYVTVLLCDSECS